MWRQTIHDHEELTMRRIRLGFLLALLLVGLAHAATLRAQATTTVERFTDPFVFDDVNPCNDEPVVVTGELNITVRTTVDSQGTTHVAYTLVPSQVRGEGASGAAYKAVGGQREHFNFTESDFPIVDTFTSVFNLVSQSGADNFSNHIVFHITITGDGITRVELEHISEECRG
jgi:hypothetical protein